MTSESDSTNSSRAGSWKEIRKCSSSETSVEEEVDLSAPVDDTYFQVSICKPFFYSVSL